jgi:hypothetical protein
VDFGKGEVSNGLNNTPNKEKTHKSREASVGLANLNRWQVESSYCQRFFPPSKQQKEKCYLFYYYYYFSFQKWVV